MPSFHLQNPMNPFWGHMAAGAGPHNTLIPRGNLDQLTNEACCWTKGGGRSARRKPKKCHHATVQPLIINAFLQNYLNFKKSTNNGWTFSYFGVY